MEDFIKSIKAFLYDRTSSPLFGALVITWLTSNYRAVLISISDTAIEKKLELLSTYFNEIHCQWAFNHSYVQFTWYIPNWVARGIGYPIAATIIYIYVYPFFAERVYRFSQSSQAKLKTIQLDAEKKTPISFEKSQELYTKLHLADAQHAKEVNEYRDEIDRLKQTIQSLEASSEKEKSLSEEITVLKADLEKLRLQPSMARTEKPIDTQDHINKKNEGAQHNQLSTNELKQLKYFVNQPERVRYEKIIDESNFTKVMARNLCSSLENKGLIKETAVGGYRFYELTPEGTKILLELDGVSREKDGRSTITGY